MGRTGFAEKRLADARSRIAEDMRHHVLVSEGPGRWFAGRPQRSEYHFRVIFAPGAVVMLGDIGELVLLPHDRDALAWLCGTLRDGRELGYPLSKIPTELRREEFEADLAEEILADEVREKSIKPDEAAAIRDAYKGDDQNPGTAWDAAWYELTEDSEFPSARYWTWRTIYQLEALRWFVSAILRERDVWAAFFSDAP